jgi:epsilon-lactone hydrolase
VQPPAVAETVEVSSVNCGPCEADFIVPDGGDASRIIIFYHGGGFFFFSARTHRVITTRLARASGCAVLVPDYHLAPENPAPAAHDDAFSIYQWALSQGYSPSKITLGGDSAGGNLALATAVRAGQAALPLPNALVLISPWLDFAEEGASYRNTLDDPILKPELTKIFMQAYIGDGDRKSPKVTPFYADFSNMPPTLVHVGSWERLRDDSVALVERMRKARAPAELKIFNGMCHGWQLYAPMLEEGATSIEECGAFVRNLQT